MHIKIEDDAEILQTTNRRNSSVYTVLNLLNNNLTSPSEVIIPIPKGVSNHIGEKHNLLTIVGCLGQIGNTKDMYWLLKCDCGKYTASTYHNLVHNRKKSCGCLRGSQGWHEAHIGENASRFKHGMSYSRLYHIWAGMHNRCSNPNASHYSRYGGRGISVCEEWEKFEPFMIWALSNGYEDNLSIDRIDNDSGYNPSNCRWVEWVDQMNNRSCTHNITSHGLTMTATQWARALGTSFTNVTRWERLGTLDKKVKSEIIDCDSLQVQKNAIRPRINEDVIVA